eukprot:610078-Amphidinium_carterae.4
MSADIVVVLHGLWRQSLLSSGRLGANSAKWRNQIRKREAHPTPNMLRIPIQYSPHVHAHGQNLSCADAGTIFKHLVDVATNR